MISINIIEIAEVSLIIRYFSKDLLALHIFFLYSTIKIYLLESKLEDVGAAEKMPDNGIVCFDLIGRREP